MSLLPPSFRSKYRHPDPANGVDEVVEFRAFTHGLQPETVPAMMEAFTEDWRRFGVDAWNEVPNHWRPDSDDRVGWWSLPTYLADEFVAPLLGVDPGTCILQPHVHWTVQCLLSAPEVAARGTEIVVTDGEFPSVLHSVQQWSDLIDVQPRIVPSQPDGRPDVDAILDAIGPDTAMTAISHVGFTTGALLPDDDVRALVRATHRHEGLFLLDGYHSASTMPLSLTDLDMDVFTGGLLKEASGSAGNAFVYLRDGLDITPRLTGWFGDADPFGFNTQPRPNDDVRRRFLGGTTSVASMYHAVEGVDILLDAGLENVREHSLALSSRAIEHAERLGLSLRSPRAEQQRSAMILIEVENAHALCEYLKTKGVYTDSRKDAYLRMAPFVWNTKAEVDRAFDIIGDAISNGEHLDAPILSTGGPVT
ncbi:aminotransferase [Longibacter salinarum]|uniref:Aminotransferase n=1 Tax=Longibacter salinarum TaxID=1850348 RepID=A0A2A8D264_9BACT|nr:aminotransferase class V-fold PLP-dependent enzyme [Longibacter salinarum]PEN14974.1 aminotransferase [Longibacter salinarum]